MAFGGVYEQPQQLPGHENGHGDTEEVSHALLHTQRVGDVQDCNTRAKDAHEEEGPGVGVRFSMNGKASERRKEVMPDKCP